MTEPTLGRRIMIEATICKDAPAGSAIAGKAWADLRALCARADAAERLAVALVELFDCPDDDGDLMRQVREEYNKALAAWRALGVVDAMMTLGIMPPAGEGADDA